MCRNAELKSTKSLDNTPCSTSASASASASADESASASADESASQSNTNFTSTNFPATMNNNYGSATVTPTPTTTATNLTTATTRISCINGNTSGSEAPFEVASSITNSNELPLFKKITNTILWLILAYASKEFAKFLSIHQSVSATLTFIPASYYYDEQDTLFDNTILTYGTDMMIGFIMTYASYKCYQEGNKSRDSHAGAGSASALGYKASALFGSYAISVFCGAYGHYTFRDIDSMNTLSFRFWWTLCVGTVTIAGGFMGMCGSEICNYFDGTVSSAGNGRRFDIIGYINVGLWWYYGLFMTAICIMGEISYKRPACDIFVAGTTQFVPTMYCMLILSSIRWNDAIPKLEGSTATSVVSSTSVSKIVNVQRKIRIFYYIGFILNAPLLPSYPLLVQYTNLSLGVVNALLHLNLTFAWGMQAWSLYNICSIIRRSRSANSNYALMMNTTATTTNRSVGVGVGGGGAIGLQEKKTL